MRKKDTANLVTFATQGVGRAGLCVVLLIAVIGLLAGCGSGASKVAPKIGEQAAKQVDNAPTPRIPSEPKLVFTEYPGGVHDPAANPTARGLSDAALRARVYLDNYYYEGDVYDKLLVNGVCTGFEYLMGFQQDLEDGTLEIDASDFEGFLVEYITSFDTAPGYDIPYADVVDRVSSFVETYLESEGQIPPSIVRAYFQGCVLRS
jgi:hypothetical protein